jgi:hypothetical protein
MAFKSMKGMWDKIKPSENYIKKPNRLLEIKIYNYNQDQKFNVQDKRQTETVE